MIFKNFCFCFAFYALVFSFATQKINYEVKELLHEWIRSSINLIFRSFFHHYFGLVIHAIVLFSLDKWRSFFYVRPSSTWSSTRIESLWFLWNFKRKKIVFIYTAFYRTAKLSLRYIPDVAAYFGFSCSESGGFSLSQCQRRSGHNHIRIRDSLICNSTKNGQDRFQFFILWALVTLAFWICHLLAANASQAQTPKRLCVCVFLTIKVSVSLAFFKKWIT